MNWKFLFFSLQGRISRKWWWIGMITVLFASYGLSIGLLWLTGEDPSYYWNDKNPTPQTALIEAIVFIITLRASFAVDIKRIHDRTRTAYLLVPLYLGELGLITLDGSGLNPLYFSPQTSNPLFDPLVLTSLIFVLIVYAIWLLIELGLGRGTRGETKYGPDPTAPLTASTDETI